MTTINYEQKIKALEKRMTKNDQLQRTSTALINKLHRDKERDPKIKAAWKTLRTAEKKHDDKITAEQKRKDRLQDSSYDMKAKIDALKDEWEVSKATKKGTHTAESARAYLQNFTIKPMGRDCYGDKEKREYRLDIEQLRKGYHKAAEDDFFHLKKTLANGIKVFQNNGWRRNEYFAFDGMRLVAYWGKDKPQHRGDHTESSAWIGQASLTFENRLQIKHKVRDYTYLKEPLFFEWVSALEAKKPKTLKTIGRTVSNIERMGGSDHSC